MPPIIQAGDPGTALSESPSLSLSPHATAFLFQLLLPAIYSFLLAPIRVNSFISD